MEWNKERECATALTLALACTRLHSQDEGEGGKGNERLSVCVWAESKLAQVGELVVLYGQHRISGTSGTCEPGKTQGEQGNQGMLARFITRKIWYIVWRWWQTVQKSKSNGFVRSHFSAHRLGYRSGFSENRTPLLLVLITSLACTSTPRYSLQRCRATPATATSSGRYCPSMCSARDRIIASRAPR